MIILIVLNKYYSFQISLLLIISVFFQSILLSKRLFIDPLDQKISFFNEMAVSIYLYLMLCLTDFHGDNSMRDDIGLFLLFLVIFIIGINVIKSMFIYGKFLKNKLTQLYKAKISPLINRSKKYQSNDIT